MEKGATVHIVIEDPNDGIRSGKYLKCDKDERCGGKPLPLDQKKRLKQRTDYINKLYRKHRSKGVKQQRVVCLHVDSRAAHKRQDVFFYYYGKSRTGKKLAKNMQSTLKAKYRKHQKNRGFHGSVTSRPLYMLRNTDAPAVYVELANIRNAADRKRLVEERNREVLARWLAEGIAR